MKKLSWVGRISLILVITFLALLLIVFVSGVAFYVGVKGKN